MGKPLDLTGQKFHALTAIKLIGTVSREHDPKHSDSQWLFVCDCGNQIAALGRYVRRGYKKSCGCHVRRGWKSVAYRVYRGTYADGDISLEQFITLSQKNCYYCNEPPANHREYNNNKWSYNGLDRLDNSQTHNLNNVVPCCWTCNERKGNWNHDQFLSWIAKVHQNVKG